jgi:DNA-binding beta-propeller fold protein YncE
MLKKWKYAVAILVVVMVVSCDDNDEKAINEDPGTFKEQDDIELTGGEAAAEISAYDPATKQLFVVNNANGSVIDVIDISTPASLVYVKSIDVAQYGGGVNSVAVKNGLLAAAIEADTKTDNGKIVVFDTKTLAEKAAVNVGALPDMVTFSPDGKYILSANEGEPNDDYTADPVGSVSIITVGSYASATLDFAGFAGQADALKAKGLRMFGRNASFAQDMEPEYIAVSSDSKLAWATLQENNAIAYINLESKTVTGIFPLGFKNHSTAENALDASDKDNSVTFSNYPIFGMYLPDAIASFNQNGTNYVITVNEGDVREYSALKENVRIKDVTLDAAAFPEGAALRVDAKLGRLYITNTMGDTDGDGDYDKLYNFGGRSFTIWNGSTGELVHDSGSKLEKDVIEKNAALYDDARSDDKGVEPEGVTIGKMGNRTLAFVGLERADAVVIYDITNIASPTLVQILTTGDAPEGVLFIPANESPNGKSLLVVSSEGDGKVKVFQPDTL